MDELKIDKSWPASCLRGKLIALVASVALEGVQDTPGFDPIRAQDALTTQDIKLMSNHEQDIKGIIALIEQAILESRNARFNLEIDPSGHHLDEKLIEAYKTTEQGLTAALSLARLAFGKYEEAVEAVRPELEEAS